jgi:hypothetical protein
MMTRFTILIHRKDYGDASSLGSNFQIRQGTHDGLSLQASTWNRTQFSCGFLDFGRKYLTSAPLTLQPPSRSHAMSVAPQYKLTYGERDNLVLSETLSPTERIQNHDALRPRRSRSSKPRDMGSRRAMADFRLSAHVVERKIAQAFPAQPGFRVVKHTVKGLESLADEMHTPTLCTEYPAPRGLISHF